MFLCKLNINITISCKTSLKQCFVKSTIEIHLTLIFVVANETEILFSKISVLSGSWVSVWFFDGSNDFRYFRSVFWLNCVDVAAGLSCLEYYLLTKVKTFSESKHCVLVSLSMKGKCGVTLSAVSDPEHSQISQTLALNRGQTLCGITVSSNSSVSSRAMCETAETRFQNMILRAH